MQHKFTTKAGIIHFCLSAALVIPFLASAREVPFNTALKVAENFYKQQSGLNTVLSSLKYTSYDVSGTPLFYAFEFNNLPTGKAGKKGFVIISAEDAGKPIIGYSTNEVFDIPDPKSNIGLWLADRAKEISYLKTKNISANDLIKTTWTNITEFKQATKSSAVNSVAPLLTTTWNQSPQYNALCPGNSVTGCVATTMAQIMKYWNHPAQGTGSSSYCDCVSAGYPNNYGTLSANYAATTYNWNNMPNYLTGPNNDVATLMLHCGISVEMNYDPSGSSAIVIKADDFVCAETAFGTYFGYDANIIQGVHRNAFFRNDWIAKLKGDLDIGRPVQYAGFGNVGGHTWVCDGYDQNELFHMNWGWGGSSNGYFDVDALNPSGMDFSAGQEGLFGIVPLATNAIDAGAVNATPVNGCSDIFYSPQLRIRNYGINTLTTCVVSYKLDNDPIQTINWAGTIVTGQSMSIPLTNYTLSTGMHTLTAFTSNPNNAVDANNVNNQMVYTFQVYSPENLPIVEGFEVPASTANHWVPLPSGGSNWSLSNTAFSSGAKSMMVDNMSNTAGNTSIMQGLNDFDLSNASEPYIAFKVAYKQKTNASNDKLRLEISNDCGLSWWLKWSKQGSALASGALMPSGAFVPAPSDFISYNVPATIANNVIFRWVFEADASAPGNNIYIDDINIYDNAVGIKENKISVINAFELYPNPANGETFLNFNLANNANVKINVRDIFGREVVQINETELNAGDQTISINKNAQLSKGIYFVSLVANGVQSTRKLVVN